MSIERDGRTGPPGFTLIEAVLIVAILGVLAAIALPAYLSMSAEAERASVEHTIGTLSSTMNIQSGKLLVSGLPITAHNPFDDLSVVPDNYAGAFPDVDQTNCQPGQWAFQGGAAANGNWAVVVYRPKVTLASAFSWSGTQWILYEVHLVTDSNGNPAGLALVEFPPPHQW